MLPLGEHDSEAPAFAWWRAVQGRITQSGVAQGAISQDGQADDLLLSAGFAQDDRPAGVTLLLSNDDVAVRVHSVADMTVPQALAAACIDARGAAIDADEDLHSAAAVQNSEGSAVSIISATASKLRVEQRLAALGKMGLHPDHIMPAAALMPPPAAGYGHFVVAGQPYLRGTELAAADDPALRQALLIDDEPLLIAEDAVLNALADLPSQRLPDLRSGIFAARPGKAWFTSAQKKWLGALAAVLVVVSLIIPAVRLWVYSSAEKAAAAQVLTKVQADFPGATDIITARTQVDAELARRGAGASVFSVPASALLIALERSGGVTLQDMQFQPGGTIAAKIAAKDENAMAKFLEDLQINQGFTLTCEQCETPGQTVFDITVRG